MTDLTWRWASRVVVSGGDSWFPVERVDVVRTDGAARVVVETWPAVIDDLEVVAREHAATVAAAFQDWVDDGLEAAVVLGQKGFRRRCRWLGPDGVAMTGTLAYASMDGHVCVVTTAVAATAAASMEADVAAEAEGIAASATVGRSPNGNASPTVATDNGGSADWSSVRQAWVSAPAVPVDVQLRVRLTVEEATAAARQRGAADFPGVDTGFLTSFDGPALEVALFVAGRSVDARAAADDELARWLALAAAHDLLVVCETASADRGTLLWCAARPDSALLIAPDPHNGTILLGSLHPAALSTVLLGHVAAIDDVLTPGITASAADVDSRVRGELDVPSLSVLGVGNVQRTRIRTVYRDGATVAGGELQWLDDGAGHLWQLDAVPGAAEVALEPIGGSALLGALLAVLPGVADPVTQS